MGAIAQKTSKIAARDLWQEAWASIAARSSRTLLTILGMALGVGTVVAVLGLSTTASAQIDSAFSPMLATQVTWHDNTPADPFGRRLGIPADIDNRIESINGVISAGHIWGISASSPKDLYVAGYPQTPNNVKVQAVSTGYLETVKPDISGVGMTELIDSSHLRVALIGSSAAKDLGIKDIKKQPMVMIKGVGYRVIGICGQSERAPTLPSSIIIPAASALIDFGKPTELESLSVVATVKAGAADQVAQEGSRAAGVGNSSWFTADALPPPLKAQSQISNDLQGLLYALAAVTLVIAIVGIANTTLVSTMERRGEIGLRQALGARPKDIVLQLLVESGLLGAVGGLIGSALGTIAVVIIAVLRHWTATVDPAVTLVSPLLGVICAALAAAYPAWVASRMEPLASLRR